MDKEAVVHIHNGISLSQKRNPFVSVLMRWMNLEPIIQSEVSQKEKYKYHLLRQWHPTPVLLPGKSHGRRSLVGYSPWGCEESDTTERLHFPFSLLGIGEGNGNSLQCSCLENPRDGGAWWATVHGVAKSQTRLTGEEQQPQGLPNLYQILLLRFSEILIERLPSPVLGAQGTLDELQVCVGILSNDQHVFHNNCT